MANKNCYIYTRVSTTKQIDGYSLDAQKQTLLDCAKFKNLNVAGVYCDAGKSGKDIAGRPSFQQMMSDIKSQKDNVSYVLVFKLSRFGRNSADILRSIQELKDYDVDLVSVKESIDSSTQGGKLTLSLLSAVAEMERENILTQFKAGRLQKVMEGGFPGGDAPYGYRIKDKELVIESEKASVVKKIFEMYLDDEHNIGTVADALGLPISLIATIISNPIYCGRRYFNRKTSKKDANGHTLTVDPNNVIVSKSKTDSIVSEEVFDQAQSKRKQLAMPFINGVSNVHILSGLIECPVCKKRMSGFICKNKSRVKEGYCKPYYGYHCSHALREDCTFNTSIRQEDINHYVFEVIKHLEFYKEFNDAIDYVLMSKDRLDLLNKKLKDLKVDLENTEIMKDKIAEKLDGLNPMNANYESEYNRLSDSLDDYYDKIDELEIQIDDTTEEIKITSSDSNKGRKCKDYLLSLNEVLDKMSDKEKKELCNLLIDRIEIDKDTKKVKTIRFKIPLAYEGDGLIHKDDGDNIDFVLDASTINIKPRLVKPKGTYTEIQQYIKSKYNANVHTYYIAQIKRKYGVDMGKCYHKSKAEKQRVLICPKEKEEMILDAFKYFEIDFKECE